MEPVTLFKPQDPVQRPLVTRRRPPLIELPRPEALTSVPLVLPLHSAALRQWGRDTAGLPVVWDVWRRRLACFLSTWSPPGEREPADLTDAHDRHLGIVRTRAAPTLALLHGVVVSLDRFCQECTGAREFREHAVIPAALIEIWQLLLQDPDPVRPSVGGRLVDVHGRAPDAARRWAVGQHLLATLTQGQIVSLLAYERLPAQPTIAQTRAFLQRTTRLCQAGAAACRFTADLAHSARTQSALRSHVEDPVLQTGQEGRSMDHRHLIEVLTRLRPLLARARSVCPQEHAAMTEAVSRWCTERHQLLNRTVCAPAPVQNALRRPAPGPTQTERERVITTPPPSSRGTVIAPVRLVVADTARPPVRPPATGSLARLFTRLAGGQLSAHT